MCGIAGLLLSPEDLARVDVGDMVKTLALEIEHRGKDATGVARLTAGNRLRVTKFPCKATQFFTEHPQIGADCRLVLIHTRAATGGDPKAPGGVNNHPITSGPITLIHNGIIGNDNGIYAKYGWNRVGQVDSEVIPTAIHNLGWRAGLELIEGSCAVAWHDMGQPGHLFIARHTSNPVHIGVSDTGSVVFASTNAAVAKAMAVLGATLIKIDSIAEGKMVEFFIDDNGVLVTVVEDFDPPAPVYARSGSWDHLQGAWFPSDRGTNLPPRPTASQAAASARPATVTTTTTGAAMIRGWDIGAEGYVIRMKDEVVFVPNDTDYQPIYGKLTHFGGRQGFAFVDCELDWGVNEEVVLPMSQLLPMDVWTGKSKRNPEYPPLAAPKQPLALPAAVVTEILDDEEADNVDDTYMPKTLAELIEAVEEIFGPEVVDLIPISWDREANPTLYDIEDERDVIDVEEAMD